MLYQSGYFVTASVPQMDHEILNSILALQHHEDVIYASGKRNISSEDLLHYCTQHSSKKDEQSGRENGIIPGVEFATRQKR